MSRSRSAWIALGLKLLVTTVLLYYFVSKVRMGPLLAQIAAVKPAAALAAIGLTLLQLALGSLRWRSLSERLGVPLAPSRALRFTLIGQFFNQLLPTAFGGDAVRAWLASSDRATLARSIRAVLCDRIVGLVALLLLISVAFLALPRPAAHSLAVHDIMRATVVVTLLGLAVLYLLGAAAARWLEAGRWTRALGTLIGDVHAALFSRATSALMFGTSVIAHLAAVGAIWLCCAGLRVELGFGAALSVLPVVVLVSMAPVSLAGWGLREGAMVVGLGTLGVGHGEALAVSVTYGLVQIAAGIPGALLWLFGPGLRRMRPVDAGE